MCLLQIDYAPLESLESEHVKPAEFKRNNVVGEVGDQVNGKVGFELVESDPSFLVF